MTAPPTSRFARSARSALQSTAARALLLGLVGLWLNGIEVNLLGEETPIFLFGGGAALVSFVWLGPVAGLLTTLVSIAGFLAELELARLLMLVYLVEAAVIWWLARRVGSLVFAAVLFWFSVGWALDIAVYGALLDVSSAYLTLLFVKQLFNAVLNALAAELVLLALGVGPLVRRGAKTAVPLRDYIFARIVFLVMVLGLPVGLLVTRSFYAARVELFESVGDEALQELQGSLRERLERRQRPLTELSRLVEIDWARSGAGPSERLAAFLAGRPEYLNVGLADAGGRILDIYPAVNARGEPIAAGSIADRGYFRQARDERRTAYGGLIPGTLQVRTPDQVEPIVISAEPLLAANGEFAGALFAALDVGALRAELAAYRDLRDEPTVSYTLVDRDRRVIATLLPRLEPGTVFDYHLGGDARDAAVRSVGFYSSPDDDTAAYLRIDLRLANAIALGSPPWTLVRDGPVEILHAEVAGAARRALPLFIAALVLLYLVVARTLRGVTRSLLAVGSAVEAIAVDRLDATVRVDELARSPIRELRDIAEQAAALGRMVAAQRHGAAEALARSERKLRAILEHSSNLFYAHTPDHVLTYVSPQSRTYFDCEPEEARVRWTELISDHPVNQAGFAATARAVATGVRQPRFEIEIVGRRGRKLWVEVDEAPVVEDGRVVEVVGALQDITPRKSAERERDRLEQELRQAQKLEAVGQLAGGVAHEFNNLLGVILGYAEMLSDDPALPAAQRGFAAEVRQAAARAADLTRQLLAFSRRQVLQPKLLDLDAGLADSSELLRGLLGERHELRLELAAAGATVRVDPSQLDQVVINLVLNARDAMPDGGTVTLRTRRLDASASQALAGGEVPPGDYVVLEVTDHGVGMDAETQSRLFEPFFTTKQLGAGTGLGLATVYGIVKQSGGSIAVASSPGAGTTLSIYLPCAETPASAAAAAATAVQPAASTATVLLVEDDPQLRQLMCRQVESFGYRVLTAADGADALERAAQHAGAIDLLLTDVVMPKMSGAQLAERLRAVRPHTAVVFVSGYPQEQLGGPAPLAPHACLLPKPFSQEALAAVLAERLAASRDRRPTLDDA